MTRQYSTIKLPKPSETDTAPHRYTWDGANNVDGSYYVDRDNGTVTPPHRDFMNASPYKVGDVVYVVYGEGFALAYISLVSHDYDAFGDRRHMYRVHRQNVRGDAFSKTFYYVWPGQIQRGYTRAGLAPDCEGKV